MKWHINDVPLILSGLCLAAAVAVWIVDGFSLAGMLISIGGALLALYNRLERRRTEEERRRVQLEERRRRFGDRHQNR